MYFDSSGKYVSSTCGKLSRDLSDKQLSLFVQAKSGKGKKEGQKTSDYSLHFRLCKYIAIIPYTSVSKLFANKDLKYFEM